MNCKELYDIYIIDEEIKKIEKAMKPKELILEMNNLKKEYDELKAYYTDMKKDEEESKVNMASLEVKSENMIKELKEYEKQLYSSSSVKAIEGYQKSVDKLNIEIKELDERIYGLLDRLESIKKNKEEALEKSKVIKSEYQGKRGEYDIKISDLNNKRAALMEQRSKMVLGIKEDLYKEYESIRKNKGYGVGIIKEEICSGCGMDVPCIIINEVKNSSNTVKCPNCGRFIYMEI